MKKIKAIFLDRDGVINYDSPDYIKTWKEFEFIPGSVDAIVNLSKAGFLIFIVSNQSGVAKGIVKKNDLYEINYNLIEHIYNLGGNIEGWYYCTHAPDYNCWCRKPMPGMILKIKREFNVDLTNSIMIGDNIKDILCAQNALCSTSIIVKSGYKKIEKMDLIMAGAYPTYITNNLKEGSELILNHFIT